MAGGKNGESAGEAAGRNRSHHAATVRRNCMAWPAGAMAPPSSSSIGAVPASQQLASSAYTTPSASRSSANWSVFAASSGCPARRRSSASSPQRRPLVAIQ